MFAHDACDCAVGFTKILPPYFPCRPNSLSLFLLERLTWSHCVAEEVGGTVESGEGRQAFGVFYCYNGTDSKADLSPALLRMMSKITLPNYRTTTTTTTVLCTPHAFQSLVCHRPW